jgi:DNA primase
MHAVLDAARPLADMVWEKEISAGVWDTPERRAALEARIEEVINQIADPKVKSHYAQDLRGRIARLFGKNAGARAPFQGRAGGFRRQPWKPGQRFDPRLQPVTPELRRSALARSDRAAGQGLEDVLLATLLNHPALLEAHCEAISRLELKSATLDKLRNEIIDIAALSVPLEREALMNHLVDRDLADIAQRLAGGAAVQGHRFAQVEASFVEAEAGFLHLLSSHRRTITLEAEFRAAERALAQEMTDENWARFQDLKKELESQRPEFEAETASPAWGEEMFDGAG